MKYPKEYWQDVSAVAESVINIDSLKNKSIVITGASGLIGSSIVEVLFYLNHKDFNIKLFLAGRDKEKLKKRFEEFEEGRDYFFVNFDAREQKTLEVDADYFIHCAGFANPALYSRCPVETMLTHINGTVSVLESALKSKAIRVVLISSSEIYGEKEDEESHKENEYNYLDILSPRSCYPSAKRAAETLCASYMDEYNIDFISMRPGHIYGPFVTDEDNRVTAQFSRFASRGNPIVMKSLGLQKRSFCYSLDCASSILTGMISGKAGQAYNISEYSGNISIKDLAQYFSDLGNVTIDYQASSEDERKGYTKMHNSVLNAEETYKLGWQPKFSILQGVAKTIYYQRQLYNEE